MINATLELSCAANLISTESRSWFAEQVERKYVCYKHCLCNVFERTLICSYCSLEQNVPSTKYQHSSVYCESPTLLLRFVVT